VTTLGTIHEKNSCTHTRAINRIEYIFIVISTSVLDEVIEYILYKIEIKNFRVALPIKNLRTFPLCLSIPDSNALTLTQFFIQLLQFRLWLPKIMWNCLALLLDMFCVSLFGPGVMLYIYDQKYIQFPWFHGSLPNDVLFAIYEGGFFLGDSLSRRIFYQTRLIFPLLFLLFAILGIGGALSNISFFIPFCGFLVAFCNGSIYSQTTRTIDTRVDEKYNLIAFSFWLFVGDIGSVIGSNVISYVSVDIHKLYHGS